MIDTVFSILVPLLYIFLVLLLSKFAPKISYHGDNNLYSKQSEIYRNEISCRMKLKRESIISCFFWLVNLIRHNVDPIYNLIRIYSERNFLGIPVFGKRPKNLMPEARILFYHIIDALIFFYLLLIIVIKKFNLGGKCIIAQYFILWRILSIFFIKLDEIGFINIKMENIDYTFFSFRRTVLLTFINIFELLFAFSYLYSLLGVFENNCAGFFYTLNVFDVMVQNNQFSQLCALQQSVVIFQGIVFFLIFSVFIANLAGLRYKK